MNKIPNELTKNFDNIKGRGSGKAAIRFRDTDWHNTVEATFPDGHTELFTGWNGERWNEGRPVYRFEVEGIDPTALEENSPEWDRACEIVDIER